MSYHKRPLEKNDPFKSDATDIDRLAIRKAVVAVFALLFGRYQGTLVKSRELVGRQLVEVHVRLRLVKRALEVLLVNLPYIYPGHRRKEHKGIHGVYIHYVDFALMDMSKDLNNSSVVRPSLLHVNLKRLVAVKDAVRRARYETDVSAEKALNEEEPSQRRSCSFPGYRRYSIGHTQVLCYSDKATYKLMSEQ